jgi:hypothetical protein
MNRYYKMLIVLAALMLFVTACIPPVISAVRAAPEERDYRAVLGKPVSDSRVADFVISNDCAPAGPFQLCRPAGVVLGTDEKQIVQTAYLVLHDSDGFAPYAGELPLGLAATDTRQQIEEKLGSPAVPHIPQAGWVPGLPDTGDSPDHIHYWAVYRRLGVTIIYDSPSPDDKNAGVHAILVHR